MAGANHISPPTPFSPLLSTRPPRRRHLSLRSWAPVGPFASPTRAQWSVALCTYSALVALQQVTILVEAKHVTFPNWLAVAGSSTAFVLLMAAAGSAPRNASYMVLARLVAEPVFWLALFQLLAVTVLPLVAIKYVRLHHPSVLGCTRSSTDDMRLRLAAAHARARQASKAVTSMLDEEASGGGLRLAAAVKSAKKGRHRD